MAIVKTGVEQLVQSPPPFLQGKRLGLLCNPASVGNGFDHSRDLIRHAFKGMLTALFSPQHGFFAEKQDNMIESDHCIDPASGIQVFSLYGKTRIPTEEMMDSIDTLLIDLQDVGTRVYTFIYTMSYCMEAAKTYGKHVVVLDRPNPLGGIGIEGNCLKEGLYSFVGRYPIPMRHGLTIGELALLFNEHFGIGCRLDIIPMSGWKRAMLFSDTGLPWIAPSPNLPTPSSAMVYPGQVIWEGTNISEGRGTTQPFELVGAPFLDPEKVLSAVDKDCIQGAVLRITGFEPTSNKWASMPCRGFQIHVTDPLVFKPYMAGLALLKAILSVHGDGFQYKKPPYEYEYEKLPMDLIIGDTKVRKKIEKMEPLSDIEQSWQANIEDFKKSARRFYQYA